MKDKTRKIGTHFREWTPKIHKNVMQTFDSRRHFFKASVGDALSF